MKTTKLHILSLSIAILAMSYVMSALFDLDTLESFSRGIVFPLFVVLYFLQNRQKNVFFAGFLILFSISEAIFVFYPGNSVIYYYFCNIMSVLAYVSLIVYFLKRMNLLVLLRRFKIFLVVLAVCNTYIVYMLNEIILNGSTVNVFTISFFLESFYNLTILIALSCSLLSYLYHDSKEDLLLFLATACIVFSEMIYVTTLYTVDNYIYGMLYTVFFTAGFALVYTFIVSKINTYYRVLF